VVALDDGYFVVALGSTTPLPLFDGATRYLGIKVADDPEMTPREELVSVPYALMAGDVIGREPELEILDRFLDAIPAEPAVALATRFEPLVKLLELVAARVGPHQFPEARAFDDASWVGYRLAEVLPLPLSIKQGMLEINDSDVRLSLLQKFLQQQGVV